MTLILKPCNFVFLFLLFSLPQMSNSLRKKDNRSRVSGEHAPAPSSKRRGASDNKGGNGGDDEEDGNELEDEADLEFEDPFGDEFEEEIIVDGDSEEARADAARYEPGGEGAPASTQRVWRAGLDPIGEDEVLDHDPTAYTLFHKLKVEWPCLSIDILRDSLGAYRTKLPAALYMVAGSQADDAGKNKVSLLKITNLCRTSLPDEDEDDDDDDDEDGAAGQDPLVEARAFKHPGGVNRIRAMPQQPSLVATWADTGAVHLWNMSAHSASIDAPTEVFEANNKPMASMLSFEGHGSEGFALDWSHVAAGRLASGCCGGKIFLYTVDPAGAVTVDAAPFNVHEGASVEDIQWSATEEFIFAAGATDGTVRIFDSRAYARGRHMLSVKCHDADVNVISWNRNGDGSMLASGGDDGRLRVWDLRYFSQTSVPADFNYHKKAITSVQWHPHEESVLIASSEDDSVSVWDLALEADAEEVAREATGAQMVDYSIPPQLLFVHMGQTHIKEAHFHPQVRLYSRLYLMSIRGYLQE